ncbi:MAG: hypothetical protein J6I61_12415, partial [Prevotella sp.]|nr:hypothetical protein [Prevotella sp.]
MNVLELSEQEIGRRESLQQLRQLGIDPYPAAEYATNAFSTEIKQKVESGEWVVDAPEGEEPIAAENLPQVTIAGRMMSRRVMGKASFAEI